MKKLKSKCKPIDDLLNGGIEYGIVTMIYGESGVGKTNFCLQISKECANEKKVIYVDSEGVSLERLHQISGDKYKKIVDNIFQCVNFLAGKEIAETKEKSMSSNRGREKEKNQTQNLFRCIQCDCLTDCETTCNGCGGRLCHGCSDNIEDQECAFCMGTDDVL